MWRTPPTTFWLPSLFRRCSTFCVNGLTTPMAGVCPTMCGCYGKMCIRDSRSAVAAAAYRSGTKLTNEWDGMIHDYTRKGGIVHAEINEKFVNHWYKDGNGFWTLGYGHKKTLNDTVDNRKISEQQALDLFNNCLLYTSRCV